MSKKRKQSRLLEKVRKLKSLRSVYGDYLRIKLDEEDRKAVLRSEEISAVLNQELYEKGFSSVKKEEVFAALTKSRTEQENALYSKLLGEAGVLGLNLTDEELEELGKAHERRVSQVTVKLEEDLASMPEAPAKDNISDEAETKKRIAEAIKAASEKAEKKKASLSARIQKCIDDLSQRIDAIERQVEKTSYTVSAQEIPDDIALSVKELKMYFGGVKAVDGLSFDVREGEIFGLIGPNGAGKTTVFNCITQFYKPTDGTLLFRGYEGETVDLVSQPVHDVILHGIVRTFQNVEVVPELTVLENIMIAGHRQITSGFVVSALQLPKLKMEEQVARVRARKILDFMGLAPYGDLYAFGLPYGILKKIEIARTLMCEPKLIILDEPAAGLNDSETAELARLIRSIRDEYKCTILLVEHDMGLVMDICDNICAIAFGKLLAHGTPAEIQANKDVQQAYLGIDEEAE